MTITTRRNFLKMTAAAAAMGDIVIYSPEPGDPYNPYIACWRDAEPEEFGGEDFGYGSTPERAAADLMHRFPREA
jgi:hypothetical protein